MTADREKTSGHVTASSGGTAPDYQFDIAISYASEDETIASMINRKLERFGVETFFAPSRPASRLGEHMESVFTRSYAEQTRFVVVLVSDHYPRKEWTMFELGVALDEEERRGETVVIPLLCRVK